ncbi:MAG: hypothetical protein ACKVVP_22895 [Chloroflexota bacterium]
MGKTAADTQREIVALRLEITDAAGELDRRVTRLLDVRARLNEAGNWAMKMVDERPEVIAKAGAGAALGAVMLGIGAIRNGRRKKSAAARLAAFKESSQEEAARRIEEAITQARELLASGGAAVASLNTDRGSQNHSTDSEPSMLKKLIWTALTAGSLALAGIIARKLSVSLWQAVMHEEPPSATS